MIYKTVLLLICWRLFMHLEICTAKVPLPRGICVRNRRNIYASNDIKKIPSICAKNGISYLELVEGSTVFVDKSLLIKKILDTKEKVILISSPSKTGKSINLSMLKAFFEVRVRGSERRILSQPEISTFKFFTRGIMTGTESTPCGPFDSPLQSHKAIFVRDMEKTAAALYKGRESERETVLGMYRNTPLISYHKDIICHHLGNYAVIYLDLVTSTWFGTATIYNNLKRQVSKLYSRHAFLNFLINDVITSNSTDVERKEMAREHMKIFQQFVKEYEYRRSNLTVADIENSVYMLSEMLHLYVGKPVVILMDDYSASLEYYLLERHPEGYYGISSDKRDIQVKNEIKLWRNFMRKSLTKNPYLSKAVISGTLPVNNKEMFADVEDYVHYNVMDNNLQEFYGFTDNEMEMLFEHFSINETLAKEAYSYYKGYTPDGGNLTIYNVRSIVNFLNLRKINDYWVQYSLSRYRIYRLPDIRIFGDILKPLIDGKDMWIHFVEAAYDMRNLLLSTKYVVGVKNHLSEKAIDCSLSIFYQMGLFTNSRRGRTNGTNVCIRIPNTEVLNGIKKALVGFKSMV